jgi:hypothetical protein
VRPSLSVVRPARSRPLLGRPRGPYPLGTPRGLSTNTGPLAAAVWLIDRGLQPEHDRWFVEITLAAADSELRLEIYSEEWGFYVKHGASSSWIRVTDVAFVHGRDDLALGLRTPRLRAIGPFIADLERRLGVCFDRRAPRISTNIRGADSVLAAWIAAL